MRKTWLVLASVLLAACGGTSNTAETAAVDEAASKPLEIYWIDVEGGAATLMVTPAGENILMDAGFPPRDGNSRDADRIVNVLENEVGRKEIDYFITSHYHGDHVGGLFELASRVPIKQFIDHGESIEIDRNDRAKATWERYAELVSDKQRRTVSPGDTLPVSDVDFLFVTARGEAIKDPISPVEDNPYCAGAEQKDVDFAGPENGQSVGFLLRYGKFDFLDLGDFTWPEELKAVCPKNVFGQVDLYQVSHHGMSISNSPALVDAIAPQVAVMNNGPHKGGDPLAYDVIAASPRLKDLWQGHKVLNEGGKDTDEDKIANLEDTTDGQGHWIKATVMPDGSFTVLNSRNGFSKTYQSM